MFYVLVAHGQRDILYRHVALFNNAFAFFIRIFLTNSPNVIPDFSLMYFDRYGFDRKNFSARSSRVMSI